MVRNVVICCDGTANEFAKDRTNVVKLFGTLVKDPDAQLCFYHPGLGTMAAPGFATRAGAKLAETMGLAFGYGLMNDICDAYVFLSKNYRSSDRLFLFGFSRGAYTVRALASVLYMYGLIPPDNDRFAPYVVRMMWAIRALGQRTDPSATEKKENYFALAREFKATISRVCKPHFVGVWDTVSSVGWFNDPLSLPFTASNPDIAVGRHALAIDERRAFFRSNRWVPDAQFYGPRDLLQVWFPGVHGDVGGGYSEDQSGPAKITLEWMLSEAFEHGLLIDEDKAALILGFEGGGFQPPDPDAPLHESLRGWWRLLEALPKPHQDPALAWRPNRGRRRTWRKQPIVHDSAWTRDGGQYADRLPEDAIRLSYARSKGFDEGEVTSAVENPA